MLDDFLPKQKEKIARIDDFIIFNTGSLYRDPYSFVYLKEGETSSIVKAFKNREPNPLGYCPFHTQFGISYLLDSAKSYLLGNKYCKEMYQRSMKLWRKKKKKSAKEKPEKKGSYFPIAKNTHFFIELEGLGMFYYQIAYQRKRREIPKVSG